MNLWLSVSAHSFFTFSLSRPTFPEHRTSSHRVYLVTDKWEEGWGSPAQLKVRGNYWVMKQAPTIKLLHNKNYYAIEKVVKRRLVISDTSLHHVLVMETLLLWMLTASQDYWQYGRLMKANVITRPSIFISKTDKASLWNNVFKPQKFRSQWWGKGKEWDSKAKVVL